MAKLLVVIKPDQSHDTDEIIKLLEQHSKIIDSDRRVLGRACAEALYAEHHGRWYFERNIQHMISGPSLIIGIETDDLEAIWAIKAKIREGTTSPQNRIHVSDSVESGELEYALFWEAGHACAVQ